ncbi:MAG TPA: chemotaxis response regulator protein-glutamate methylesterase [Polyangiaceae bacterium]
MSGAGSRRLEVLIVDDSAVARQVLSAVLVAAGMNVRVAPDPLFALQKLERSEPDVVVLDLEMPRMDGLTFLKQLNRERPIPVVICSGTTDGRGSKAIEALAHGAVEVVTKPKTAVREFLFESSVMLVDAVTAAAKTRPKLRAPRPSSMPSERRLLARSPERSVIALGASTGGPEAIRVILSALPNDAPPVVVAQHMPAGFTRAFASMLNRECAIEVREAVAGDLLRPGLALIAPGGRHLTLKRAAGHLLADLTTGPLVSRHRPSVDVLFESVAREVGARAVGVLMTGMGDDGARGLATLRQAGAATLAQDEASSAVFGMPKAAIELGAADEIASLDSMCEAILRRL